ncbi:Alpha/Beta hydrolase protein [Hypoxylon trugodes]|uniref:Alpha/Beta hydrolase protein n=1 Tax=Hypoxylon trugodes TaxID=326681 RepID=UPI00219226CF|nr:Alpha/Beta hydrolase protein [Hypoxylon trugodes]KAI1385899.1 Alpha/Beta hydrolase protein [Hypoxylon trugodes]
MGNMKIAWGESAGTGSILHHLIREDGKKDPLFSTFAALSPAFQWSWDNSPDSELDMIYKSFSNLSGCGYEYNINCLEDSSLEKLILANQKLFSQARTKGFFPVGPAVDEVWIQSIPAVSFYHDKYWKGIEAAIISHCANEPYSFTPKITTQAEFDEYLRRFFPSENLENVRTAIRERYDCAVDLNGNFQKCLAIVIRDAMFTCNTRDLFQAYSEVSYMMQYAFPGIEFAVHASDLIPLFLNSQQEVIDLLHEDIGPFYAWFLGNETPRTYKNYFTSFALTGDPNKGLSSPKVAWPVADGSGDELSGVMNVGLLPRFSPCHR